MQVETVAVALNMMGLSSQTCEVLMGAAATPLILSAVSQLVTSTKVSGIPEITPKISMH